VYGVLVLVWQDGHGSQAAAGMLLRVLPQWEAKAAQQADPV
jgi:hypothetical protein